MSKELAISLYKKGVEAVKPKNFIKESIRYEDGILRVMDDEYDLKSFNNLYIYGSGKASINMAKALNKILHERVKKSLVISNYYEEVEDIEVIVSSHPLPSYKSLEAGRRLGEELESLQEDDFFIYLLSGGSSALIEELYEGVTLEEFIALSQKLLESGMKIDEINSIRKALSRLKGGGLGSRSKAKGIVLVLSDVVGDDLYSIGSAPFIAQNTNEAKSILKEYDLFDSLPFSIKNVLENNYKKEIKGRFQHYILANNKMALEAIEYEAKNLGKDVRIVTDSIEGDVEDVASFISKEVQNSSEEILLFGGESTVVIKGDGKGGRNQELTLWVLKRMKDLDDFTFISAGSDGIDGVSEAAGGVVQKEDLHEEIDSYLKRSDSYHYLLKHDGVVVIGNSGTNVMDIMIAIKKRV